MTLVIQHSKEIFFQGMSFQGTALQGILFPRIFFSKECRFQGFFLNTLFHI
jgi:hypothetical protein